MWVQFNTLWWKSNAISLIDDLLLQVLHSFIIRTKLSSAFPSPVRPLTVEIASNSQPLIAGRKIDVICQSSGSRPLAQITWFKAKKKLIQSRYVALQPCSEQSSPVLSCPLLCTSLNVSLVESMDSMDSRLIHCCVDDVFRHRLRKPNIGWQSLTVPNCA